MPRSVDDSGTLSGGSSPLRDTRSSVVDDLEKDDMKPVQIILRDAEDKHKFCLNEDGLRKILTKNPETRNLPIAVLSVAGAFRKGKSFLINLLMNYVKENTIEENIPMLFSWRGGVKRDTTGILAWPELFKLTSKQTGKDFALLIMDTQGTFDDESSVRDNATIFALSCMTSSKVVYNLSQQIQEDDLQHLELFTNYGELALESGQSKPFQQITFLVRDWQFPYEYAYGRDTLAEPNDMDTTKSGAAYLKEKLKIKADTHEDLANVREHIRFCFTKADCFLMPHPGLAVAQNPKFTGQTKMIEPAFVSNAKNLFATILDDIRPKSIEGQEITASQLLHFFQTYATIFENEELPEPKTMLQATAEASLLSMLTEIKHKFEQTVAKKLKEAERALNTREFTLMVETQQGIALTKFDSSKKLGNDDLITKFRKQLDEYLGTQADRFRETNEAKRMVSSWRTPATLVLTNVLAQIIAMFLRFMFLGPIAWLFTLVAYAGWMLIGTWSYTTYSESYVVLRERIDEVAELIATRILGTGFELIKQKALDNPQVRDVVVDAVSRTGAAVSEGLSRQGSKKDD